MNVYGCTNYSQLKPVFSAVECAVPEKLIGSPLWFKDASAVGASNISATNTRPGYLSTISYSCPEG